MPTNNRNTLTTNKNKNNQQHIVTFDQQNRNSISKYASSICVRANNISPLIAHNIRYTPVEANINNYFISTTNNKQSSLQFNRINLQSSTPSDSFTGNGAMGITSVSAPA